MLFFSEGAYNGGSGSGSFGGSGGSGFGSGGSGFGGGSGSGNGGAGGYHYWSHSNGATKKSYWIVIWHEYSLSAYL